SSQTQVIEGASTVNLGVAPSSLSIAMVTGTSNLNVELDTGLSGNLTINLAAGNKNLNLTGTGNADSNSVSGNLSITATTGNQNVQLSTNTLLTVGGSARIDLGLGDDRMLADNGASIGSDITLRGVNRFSHLADLTVGGSYSQDVS